MHQLRNSLEDPDTLTAAPVAMPAPVMQGLNLFLKLKSPAQMPALLATVAGAMGQVRSALAGLHYVHFARFVPTPDGSMLLVITEFDGDLRSYIMDFVAVMGDVFTAILCFIADAPRLPVQTYPEDFWQFILKNNLSQAQPWSAYSQSTVIDILGSRRTLPPAVAEIIETPAPAVRLSDVQSNVLRGFRAARARHFAVSFRDQSAAQALLRALLDGDPLRPAMTRLHGSQDWQVRPACCVNIGLTAAGLQMLGVSQAVLAQFPEAFRVGPAARATALHDVGASAPAGWVLGAGDGGEHALISLLGGPHRLAEFEAASSALRDCLKSIGVTELLAFDAASLPEGGVHFGYRDGIAQPKVAGVPYRDIPDMQPASSAGEFLLGGGYTNQYGGNFLGDLPPWLCDHACYGAVRILQQDVAQFEQLLDDVAARFAVDREWIAAKIMGRWRNGQPLILSPDVPLPHMEAERLNHFDYAPNAKDPAYFDDFDGTRCPLGAHTRRLNPRGALVTGKPHSRRLIRRGMAYGPAYDRSQPDQIERGLFGMFFCGDLESQYEFILSVWANQNIATSGLNKASDPLISAAGGTFTIPRLGPVPPISFFIPPLTKTRGALYTLVPSLPALRRLSEGQTDATASAP